MPIETVSWSVLVQPFASVPVTVYVVITEGNAVGSEMLGLLRPDEGDQTYVIPPVALSETTDPGQTTVLLPALISGKGFTETFTESEFVQPSEFVTVTVYVVFVVGEATGFESVELFSEAVGVHT